MAILYLIAIRNRVIDLFVERSAKPQKSQNRKYDNDPSQDTYWSEAAHGLTGRTPAVSTAGGLDVGRGKSGP